MKLKCGWTVCKHNQESFCQAEEVELVHHDLYDDVPLKVHEELEAEDLDQVLKCKQFEWKKSNAWNLKGGLEAYEK